MLGGRRTAGSAQPGALEPGSWPPTEAMGSIQGRLGLTPLNDLTFRVGGPTRIQALTLLYVLGCLIGSLAIPMGVGVNGDQTGFGALLGSGCAIGFLVLRFGGAHSPKLEHLAIAYANVAILEGNLLLGASDTPFLTLFVWTTIYSGWYFSGRAAFAHTVIASICVLLTLGFLDSASTFECVVTLVTLALVCIVTSQASGRLRTLVERIELRVRTDALTRVANRYAYEEALRGIAAEGEPAPVAILTVDVDNFKQVNDNLGHPAGDRVLQAVARTLMASVRHTDPVFRVGGDEFVAVLTGAGPEAAQRAAREVQSAIAEADLPCPITLSVGISIGQNRQIYDLIRRSDRALYRVKGAGGGGIELDA